jgi:hypothetical protein
VVATPRGHVGAEAMPSAPRAHEMPHYAAPPMRACHLHHHNNQQPTNQQMVIFLIFYFIFFFIFLLLIFFVKLTEAPGDLQLVQMVRAARCSILPTPTSMGVLATPWLQRAQLTCTHTLRAALSRRPALPDGWSPRAWHSAQTRRSNRSGSLQAACCGCGEATGAGAAAAAARTSRNNNKKKR